MPSPSSVWRCRAAGLIGVLGLAAITAITGSVAFVRRASVGRIFDESDVPAAPVALVLGAQVYPDGTPSAFLTARLDVARRLFEAGKARVLLVSGDATAPEYDEPAAMRTYLTMQGVPADRIVTDRAGLDTYDSCARALRIFGVGDVVIVSQGYHLPRAVGTARRLGLRAVGVGDETARWRSYPWWRGVLRDQVACVKTVWDLASRRDPVLGPPDDRVQRALQDG